MINYDNIYSKI